MNVNITEACRLFFVRSSYTASRTPIAWLSDDNLENIDPCLAAGPAKDQRTEGPEANRCKRTSTTDVRVMVKESFVCCQTMRCVETFLTGNGDIEEELRRQQEDFSRLESRKGRTAWIGTMVPFAKQGKNQGSMKAGDIYVCNQFFCSAFGVSKCSIDSARRNPCSSGRKT